MKNKNTQKTKKNVNFIKLSSNVFKLDSFIENKNIFLEKLLNFDLIHLFYNVNKQYFDAVDFKIINDNEAILFVLMKPLFKEFGVQSRYVNLKIIREINNCGVHFTCDICEPCPEIRDKYCKVIKSPILNINITCVIMNPHLVHITEVLTFDEGHYGFALMEKLLSHMLKAIFKQTINAVEQL